VSGIFVTFEGVEGCGKSTQVKRLHERLTERGHTVLVTREPGGTPIAEAIRNVLLDPANEAMAPVAELLLYEAARAQHVAERIRPALDANAVVICDRFADSTSAYQGAGRALPDQMLSAMHHVATGGTWPDLTIVLDVPIEEGLTRAMKVDAPDRLEQEPIAFHQRVRDSFLALAKQEPNRIKVIDGMQTEEAVAEAINALVDPLLVTT
jgi:dTMP kinase